MGSTPSPKASSVVWMLRRATRRYGHAVMRSLESQGFSDLPQRGIWVVNALAERDHTQVELVQRMQITKQAVSQLIEVLVRLHYVSREVDALDSRRTTIKLTKRGKKAAVVIERACEGVHGEAMKRMGPEAAQNLRLFFGSLFGSGEP